jgi:hypothetical protein
MASCRKHKEERWRQLGQEAWSEMFSSLEPSCRKAAVDNASNAISTAIPQEGQNLLRYIVTDNLRASPESGLV